MKLLVTPILMFLFVLPSLLVPAWVNRNNPA